MASLFGYGYLVVKFLLVQGLLNEVWNPCLAGGTGYEVYYENGFFLHVSVSVLSCTFACKATVDGFHIMKKYNENITQK